MEREHLHEDLVELGVASADTKGAFVGYDDQDNGLRLIPGLSDD